MVITPVGELGQVADVLEEAKEFGNVAFWLLDDHLLYETHCGYVAWGVFKPQRAYHQVENRVNVCLWNKSSRYLNLDASKNLLSRTFSLKCKLDLLILK